MRESLAMTIDGKPTPALMGDNVAAAIMNAQGPALRQSIGGEPRGPLCGMGVCFECRVTIDGATHQRSCQLPCEAGTLIQTAGDTNYHLSSNSLTSRPERTLDVVVIGAGPGGLAAASSAAQAGRRVAIVDDNPEIGGQIWRRAAGKSLSGPTATWLARMRGAQSEWFKQTTIVGVLGPNSLLAESPSGPFVLKWRRLILACGARERFVPFPGWTLPGVYGAGGLQALVKSGFRVAGLKVVIAGSGPLLLPVAAYLRARGADVRLIAEQTPRAKLMRFTGSLLWNQPGKTLEALRLGWQIRGIPFRTGTWPVRAEGVDRVASVTLTDGARTWTESCDALACGFGLVPNLELATLLGCNIENRFVAVDKHQRTSIRDVFAVGELTGIGGVDKAVVEGQLAGWSAADQVKRAGTLASERRRALRFVALLDESFKLRDELKCLAKDDTIICRCEDVRLGTIKHHAGWRDAKLQTRCGMGPCQGRTCGPIVQQLFGWDNDSIRPPIFPVPLGSFVR